MNQVNIEIKAKCDNPSYIRQILRSHKADFKGVDHQIDTYFKVAHGRLKFREGNIENDLIYYDRENKRGPKESDIILYPTEPNSVLKLKQILIKSLGVSIVVDKKREIYFLGNVKFHIDRVKNLGSFVEIEAIDKNGKIGKRKLLEQCKYYMKLFKIKKEDLIPKSYSDLLMM